MFIHLVHISFNSQNLSHQKFLIAKSCAVIRNCVQLSLFIAQIIDGITSHLKYEKINFKRIWNKDSNSVANN